MDGKPVAKLTFMTKVVCLLGFAAFPASWYQLTETTALVRLPGFLLVSGYVLAAIFGLVLVIGMSGGESESRRISSGGRASGERYGKRI